MPEMSEENYIALMERLDRQDALIEAQNKKLADLAAMNNALLRTTDDGSQVQNPSARHAELEHRLKGGLKHV